MTARGSRGSNPILRNRFVYDIAMNPLTSRKEHVSIFIIWTRLEWVLLNDAAINILTIFFFTSQQGAILVVLVSLFSEDVRIL